MSGKAHHTQTQTFDWRDILKKLIIFVLIGFAGFIGVQLKNYFFSGEVIVEAQNNALGKSGVIEIFDDSGKLAYAGSFQNNQSRASLPPGPYRLKVTYGKSIVFDKNVMVKSGAARVWPVDLHLPNYIELDISTDRSEYKKGAAFSMEIISDTDGYFWVYAIDPHGKFSALYPASGYSEQADNKIDATVKRLLPNRGQDGSLSFTASDLLGDEEIVVIVTRQNNQGFAMRKFSELYPDSGVQMKAVAVVEKELFGWARLGYRVVD